MAEFKTAEQYVVEKVEFLEQELKQKELDFNLKAVSLECQLEVTKSRLDDALGLLNMLRDFIDISKDDYWKHIVHFENIYGKENPELVARLMEYYDMYPEEDEEDA